MKVVLLMFMAGIVTTKVCTQGQVVQLWETHVDQQERKEKRYGTKVISHIENPSIEVFLPDHQAESSPAVIICPGGGYENLAYNWEGTEIAQWFNEHGIVGIVLKYRLPRPELGPSQMGRTRSSADVSRALEIVKYNAADWNINTNQIGIIGFSAGGHLASYATNTIHGKEALAFSILVYPVISMADSITHDGTRKNLFGVLSQDYQSSQRDQLISHFSTQNLVSKDTPPTFIVHSNNDEVVAVDNSVLYYEKLREHDVPVEFHIYPKGGHGYSLFREGGNTELGWGQLCINWIESIIE